MQSSTIILNAPVRSLEMLELQIAARATEVYVGLACDELGELTFNARGRTYDDVPCQVASVRLLRSIVAEAHLAGLRVNFSANSALVAPELRGAFVDQVRAALDAGCDELILGNLGLARHLRDVGIAAPMTAGLMMHVGTASYASYLVRELNVHRVVLPHAMKLEEVAAFAAIQELLVEVPAHTGAGNSCGRCMLDATAVAGWGSGCRATYEVAAPNGESLGEVAFLDGAADCSLCSVGDLLREGARAFKIPGRESPNLRMNAKLTQLYRKMIDDALVNKPVATSVQEIDRVELSWQMRWVPRFCNDNRCKYRQTPFTNTYV